MRVNVYAEELTERVEIVEKTISGRVFTGVRFYLELPVTRRLRDGAVIQHRGPFQHSEDDDDSAAVTFWGKRDFLGAMLKAIDLLNAHRGDKDTVVWASQGARDVIAERCRQVRDEGFGPDHDDAHDAGDLAMAGGCYAQCAAEILGGSDPKIPHDELTGWWPWDRQWWKPTTPRRDLVKAAALLIAEIERIDRNAAP